MKRTAYIQADRLGQAYSANGAMAAKGFALLGFAVEYFQPSALSDLPLSRDSVVVGGMGTVMRAVESLGVTPPSHVSAPTTLYPYLGRACWRSTIGEVRDSGRFPIFLKPFDEAKTFNGQVVPGAGELHQLLTPREGFPPLSLESPVLAQEPVDFISEWRTFVMRSVIVGVSFYRGDPLAFPAAPVIRLAINAYSDAPAGYSADFGVTRDGRTLLIEINDGYSLGHGGLTANLYAELLLARWDEMTGR